MKRPHLCFVLNDAPFFLSHRMHIARAAHREGWQVTVVAPPHLESERTIRSAGMGFAPWPVSRRGLNPWREAGAILQLVRIYRRIRPEVVHHVTHKPVLYGGWAARLVRIRGVVQALSGLGYAFTAGREGGLLARAALFLHRQAHRYARGLTVFQNPDDRQVFLERDILPASRTTLIRGSGVDVDYFRPTATVKQEAAIVVPGRLLLDKGIVEAVAASRELTRRDVDHRLYLLGDLDAGNPRGITRARLEEMITDPHVEWPGHQVDMRSWFDRAQVVCLPSYREGLPKALLEAAACGLPIVTCDVPGCREVVRDGFNGFLVPRGDHRLLADRLAHLLSDASLRRRMGAHGRVLAQRCFAERVIADKHLRIYRRLGSLPWN